MDIPRSKLMLGAMELAGNAAGITSEQERGLAAVERSNVVDGFRHLTLLRLNGEKLRHCDPCLPLDAEGNAKSAEAEPVDASDFA